MLKVMLEEGKIEIRSHTSASLSARRVDLEPRGRRLGWLERSCLLSITSLPFIQPLALGPSSRSLIACGSR